MTIAVPILRAAIISGGTPSWVQSHAASMLGAEAQGLALDFTDQFWLAATGHYGSAKVIDTGTPANNFDSIPDALLTYTGTTKLCRQSDGVYRYGPHNLYVNSAAPANQSITVVSGASYAVTITGSVSVTASGAATGTWTAGTNTFTAATATLTLGSTSGSGTVHVRRTPSDSTYLATGASAKYGLPYEWDANGTLKGILVEPQATNLFLNNTTGATQTISVSNATAYTVSFFGTGSITFSGANSSTLSGTGATTRVSTTFTTGSTSLVCTVSGSITDVQVETGSVATSVIRTYAASATRAADSISLAATAFPTISAGTFFVDAINLRNDLARELLTFRDAGGTYRVRMSFSTGNSFYYRVQASTTQAGDATYGVGSITVGTTYKVGVGIDTDSFAFVVNGSILNSDTSGTLPSGYSTLWIGSNAGVEQASGYIQKIRVLPRRVANAAMQTETT